MRVVAVDAPQIIPPKKQCRPPANRQAALDLCSKVLSRRQQHFTPDQRRRLAHLLKDRSTRDGLLNGMDPDLVKIAYGLRGPAMSEAQAEAFANRHRVHDFLNHCYISGPDADERDTVSALKTLHDLIDQAMDHLAKGTAKDTFSGAANRRRVALNLWVAKAQLDPKSIYFGWLAP